MNGIYFTNPHTNTSDWIPDSNDNADDNKASENKTHKLKYTHKKKDLFAGKQELKLILQCQHSIFTFLYPPA